MAETNPSPDERPNGELSDPTPTGSAVSPLASLDFGQTDLSDPEVLQDAIGIDAGEIRNLQLWSDTSFTGPAGFEKTLEDTSFSTEEDRKKKQAKQEVSQISREMRMAIDSAPVDQGDSPLSYARRWYGEEFIDESIVSQALPFVGDSWDEELPNDEVLKQIEEKRPDFQNWLYDEDASKKEKMKKINGYYKRRVNQRRRYLAHGTMFPVLRTLVQQDAESTDEEMIKEFANNRFDGQGEMDVGRVIDEMLNVEQQVVEAAGKEDGYRVINTDKTQEHAPREKAFAKLAELANEFEKAENTEEGPGEVVLFQDPVTRSYVPLTSSKQIDNYVKRSKYRHLSTQDNNMLEEWGYGAVRSGMKVADLALELAQFTERMKSKVGISMFGDEDSKGMEAFNSTVDNWQGNMEAMMSHGSIRWSDEFRTRDMEWFEGDSWSPGEKITDPKHWAGILGEFTDSIVGGFGAVAAVSKGGRAILNGAKWYRRARRIEKAAKAGTKIMGKKISPTLLARAKGIRHAADAGAIAALYEGPMETGESLKNLYEKYDDPTGGQIGLALASGAISGFTGAFGDRAVYDMITGVSTKALRKEAVDEGVDRLRNVVGSRIAHNLKYGKIGVKTLARGGLEPLTEVTQEVTKDVIKEYGWDEDEAPSLQELWENEKEKYGDVFMKSLLFTTMMGGGRKIAEAPFRQSREDRRKIQEIQRRIEEGEINEAEGALMIRSIKDSGHSRLYDFKPDDEQGAQFTLEPETLRDPNYLDHLRELAEKSDVDPQDVRFRIQSSEAQADGERAGDELDSGRSYSLAELQARRETIVDGMDFQTVQEVQVGNGEGSVLIDTERIDEIEDGNRQSEDDAQAFTDDNDNGALVNIDGEAHLVQNVTVEGEKGGDSNFVVQSLESGETKTVEDIVDEDVLAWPDAVEQHSEQIRQDRSRRREVPIEHLSEGASTTARKLFQMGVDNELISPEMANSLTDALERYYELSQFALYTEDQSLRDQALDGAENLRQVLSQELQRLNQNRKDEDVSLEEVSVYEKQEIEGRSQEEEDEIVESRRQQEAFEEEGLPEPEEGTETDQTETTPFEREVPVPPVSKEVEVKAQMQKSAAPQNLVEFDGDLDAEGLQELAYRLIQKGTPVERHLQRIGATKEDGAARHKAVVDAMRQSLLNKGFEESQVEEALNAHGPFLKTPIELERGTVMDLRDKDVASHYESLRESVRQTAENNKALAERQDDVVAAIDAIESFYNDFQDASDPVEQQASFEAAVNNVIPQLRDLTVRLSAFDDEAGEMAQRLQWRLLGPWASVMQERGAFADQTNVADEATDEDATPSEQDSRPPQEEIDQLVQQAEEVVPDMVSDLRRGLEEGEIDLAEARTTIRDAQDREDEIVESRRQQELFEEENLPEPEEVTEADGEAAPAQIKSRIRQRHHEQKDEEISSDAAEQTWAEGDVLYRSTTGDPVIVERGGRWTKVRTPDGEEITIDAAKSNRDGYWTKADPGRSQKPLTQAFNDRERAVAEKRQSRTGRFGKNKPWSQDDILYNQQGERVQVLGNRGPVYDVRTEDGQQREVRRGTDEAWGLLPPSEREATGEETGDPSSRPPEDGRPAAPPRPPVPEEAPADVSGQPTAPQGTPRPQDGSRRTMPIADQYVDVTTIGDATPTSVPTGTYVYQYALFAPEGVEISVVTDGESVDGSTTVSILDDDGTVLTEMSLDAMRQEYGLEDREIGVTRRRAPGARDFTYTEKQADLKRLLDEIIEEEGTLPATADEIRTLLAEKAEGSGSVRRVFLTGNGGKRRIHEGGERAEGEPYFVIRYNGSEFIVPVPLTDSNYASTAALGDFGGAVDPESTPTSGAIVRPYRTIVDVHGDRVGRGLYESSEYPFAVRRQSRRNWKRIGNVQNVEEASPQDLRQEFKRQEKLTRTLDERISRFEMGEGGTVNNLTEDLMTAGFDEDAADRIANRMRGTNKATLSMKDRKTEARWAMHRIKSEIENRLEPKDFGAETYIKKGKKAFKNTSKRVRRQKRLSVGSRLGLGTIGQTANTVREQVRNVTKSWEDAPPVEVVGTAEDLSPSAKEGLTQEQLRRVKAVFDKGTITLVASNIRSESETMQVLLHEGAGHWGLRQLVDDGAAFDDLMLEIFNSFENVILDEGGGLVDAKRSNRNQAFFRRLQRNREDLNLSTTEGKIEAAEELVANLAEMDVEASVLDRLFSMIKRFVRRVFGGMSTRARALSNSELRWIVSNAKGRLEGSAPGTFTTHLARTLKDSPYRSALRERLTETLTEAPLDEDLTETFFGEDGQERALTPQEMERALGEMIDRGLVDAAEARAVGLGAWLDNLGRNEPLTLSDVRSFVAEHSSFVSETNDPANRRDAALEDRFDQITDRLSKLRVRETELSQREEDVTVEAQQNIDRALNEIDGILTSRARSQEAAQDVDSVLGGIRRDIQRALNGDDATLQKLQNVEIESVADALSPALKSIGELRSIQEQQSKISEEKIQLRQDRSEVIREQQERDGETDNVLSGEAQRTTLDVSTPVSVQMRILSNRAERLNEQIREERRNLQALQAERRRMTQPGEDATGENVEAIEQQIQERQERISEMESALSETNRMKDRTQERETAEDLAGVPQRMASLDVSIRNDGNEQVLVIEEMAQETENLPTQEQWWKLSIKRAIQYAASRGYDGVAWAPGALHENSALYDQQLPSYVRQFARAYGVEISRPSDEGAFGVNTTPRRSYEVAEDMGAAKVRQRAEATGQEAFYRVRNAQDQTVIDQTSSFEEAREIVDRMEDAPVEIVGGFVQEGTPSSQAVHTLRFNEQLENELSEQGSALYAIGEHYVHTDQFKNWFGDWEANPHESSKIVDENGEPMVLYHGTGNDFTTFDDSDPIWLTPERREASVYADFHGRRFDTSERSPNVMPVFANVRNPADITEIGEHATLEEFVDAINEHLPSMFELRIEDLERQSNGFEHQPEMGGYLVKDMMKGSGALEILSERSTRDGIWFVDQGPYRGDHQTIIAFDKTQVKSATGNDGSFSQAGDTRYSIGGDLNAQRQKVNRETIVGHLRKTLRDMQIPGATGHRRMKEFVLRRGRANMVKNGKIIVRDFEDLNTVFEYVGRFLFSHYRRWAGRTKGISGVRALRNDLDQIAEDMDDSITDGLTDEQRQNRAFAKLIGAYLRGENVKNLAPNAVSYFEEFAEMHDMKDNLHHTTELFDALKDQSDVSFFKSMVKAREGYGWFDLPRSIDDITERVNRARYLARKWYRTKMVDRYYPIYERMRDINGGRVPETVEENMYVMKRLEAGADGVAESFLEYGPRLLGAETTLSKSFFDILEPIGKTTQDVQQFEYYAIAQRLKEFARQKKRGDRPEDFTVPFVKDKDGLPVQDPDRWLEVASNVENNLFNEVGRDRATFKSVFNELQDYNDAMLQYAVEEGLLTEESKQAIQRLNQNYVPWNRAFGEEGESTPSIQIGNGQKKDQNVFQSMGGNADLRVDNPLKNLVTNTFALVRKVHSNRTLKAMYKTALNSQSPIGAAHVEIVNPDQRAVQVSKSELRDALERKDLPEDAIDAVTGLLDGATDAETDAIMTLFRPSNQFMEDPNIYKVIDEGEAKYVRISDELARATEGFNMSPAVRSVLRGNEWTNRVMRTWTTALNVGFGLVNFARDVITTPIQSFTPQKIDEMWESVFNPTKYAVSLLGDTNPAFGSLYESVDKLSPIEVERAQKNARQAMQHFKASGGFNSALTSIDRESLEEFTGRLQGEQVSTLAEFRALFAETVGHSEGMRDTFANVLRMTKNSANPLDMIEEFTSLLENVTRMSEHEMAFDQKMEQLSQQYEDENGEPISNNQDAYNQARREAALSAAFRARNVTIDFARMGEIGEHLNRFWKPFFNASIQGVERFRDTFKGKSASAILKPLTTFVLMPSVMVGLINADNPYYEEQPAFLRDMTWLIPIPWGEKDEDGYPMDFFPIPKPHMWGPAFGSIAERFTVFALQEGYYDKSDVIARLNGMKPRQQARFIANNVPSEHINTLGDQLPVNVFRLAADPSMEAMSFLPPMMKAPAEIAANRSFFMDTPIESQSETGNDPFVRYDETSSSLSRDVVDSARDLFGKSPFSAKQMDNVLFNMLGGGAKTVTSFYSGGRAAVSGRRHDNINDIMSTSEWGSILSEMTLDPITNRFVATNDFRGSKSVSEAYETLIRADDVKSTYQTLLNEKQRTDDAVEYYKENAHLIEIAEDPGVSRLKSKMQKIQEAKELVINNDEMRRAEKREAMKRIWLQEVDLSRRFNNIYEDMMHQYEYGE